MLTPRRLVIGTVVGLAIFLGVVAYGVMTGPTHVKIDDAFRLGDKLVLVDHVYTQGSRRSRDTTDPERVEVLDPATGELKRVSLGFRVGLDGIGCIVAVAHRLWCWTRDAVALVDLDALAIVADQDSFLKLDAPSLKTGFVGLKFELDRRTGSIRLRCKDGRRVVIHPDATAEQDPGTATWDDDLTPTRPHPPVPGGFAFTAGDRGFLARNGKQLGATDFLKPGFPRDEHGDVVDIDRAMFVFHQETLDKQSQGLLSRVSDDGTVMWTGKKLWNKYVIAFVAGDAFVMVTPYEVVAFDLATGAEHWRDF
jgi:hypothetical protein